MPDNFLFVLADATLQTLYMVIVAAVVTQCRPAFRRISGYKLKRRFVCGPKIEQTLGDPCRFDEFYPLHHLGHSDHSTYAPYSWNLGRPFSGYCAPCRCDGVIRSEGRQERNPRCRSGIDRGIPRDGSNTSTDCFESAFSGSPAGHRSWVYDKSGEPFWKCRNRGRGRRGRPGRFGHPVGYQHFTPEIMAAVVVVLIIFVQIIQLIGGRLALSTVKGSIRQSRSSGLGSRSVTRGVWLRTQEHDRAPWHSGHGAKRPRNAPVIAPLGRDTRP